MRVSAALESPMPRLAVFRDHSIFGAALLLLALAAGCPSATDTSPVVATADAVAPPKKFDFKPLPSPVRSEAAPRIDIKSSKFVDVAEAIGIHHVYDNGASPKSLMVESTGGGAGWFDFDRDGRLDLLLTQGGVPDLSPGQIRPQDSLYRQRNNRFYDVAEPAGIGDRGFGHGVVAGDYDNDGFDDVFIANVGESNLYKNLGDGTFELTSPVLAGKRKVWSSSGAWGDIDKDGDLDLYVCNYAIYDPYAPISCLDKSGKPAICHPHNVQPEPDEFFLNNGDGSFTECSQRMGLFGPGNKGLGVIIADLTDDGWPDIFVANDTSANFLFVNERGDKFTESALILGAAFSATGEPQANMGVAFGDFDRNGLPDICVTHFTAEGVALYQNMGLQGLEEVSGRTGLRKATLSKLGFGAVMVDFNFDRQMDLFITNGHIDPKFAESEGYEMTPQLFSFDDVKWVDQSSSAGEFFSKRLVGRAVATADYDLDGDVDLAVVHQNSPAAVLRNESDHGHYLGVSLIGRSSNRNATGAQVQVRFGQELSIQEIAGGTSYASTCQRRAAFGLDDWTGECRVTVNWPSGIKDEVNFRQSDGEAVIVEGQGRLAMPKLVE